MLPLIHINFIISIAFTILSCCHIKFSVKYLLIKQTLPQEIKSSIHCGGIRRCFRKLEKLNLPWFSSQSHIKFPVTYCPSKCKFLQLRAQYISGEGEVIGVKKVGFKGALENWTEDQLKRLTSLDRWERLRTKCFQAWTPSCQPCLWHEIGWG